MTSRLRSENFGDCAIYTGEVFAWKKEYFCAAYKSAGENAYSTSARPPSRGSPRVMMPDGGNFSNTGGPSSHFSTLVWRHARNAARQRIANIQAECFTSP